MDTAINNVKTALADLSKKVAETPKAKITSEQLTGIMTLIMSIWEALIKIFPKL